MAGTQGAYLTIGGRDYLNFCSSHYLGFAEEPRLKEAARNAVQQYGLGNTESVATLPDRSMTRIGGMISAIQQGFSKKSGKPYAMITLEDLQGQLQILCMNDQYDKHRHLFEANRTTMVIGEGSSPQAI